MDGLVSWTDWPVVEIRVADGSADDTATLVARTLQSALDRGTEFAAVVHMPDGSADDAARRRPPSGAVERVRLLKRLRPGLAERCRGLAFVLSETAQQQRAKALRSGDKVWKCPTTVTDDPELARDWVRRQLGQGA
ncbi:MAG: hypothetical protein GEV10_14595 [Streptosporangiales bacterium]|nr:hypothetical protein [Streptosporangiales bacterium]